MLKSLNSTTYQMDDSARYKMVDRRRHCWAKILGGNATARSGSFTLNQSIHPISTMPWKTQSSVISNRKEQMQCFALIQFRLNKDKHYSNPGISFLSHSLLMQSVFLRFPYFHERMLRLQTISRQESQTFQRKANKRCQL